MSRPDPRLLVPASCLPFVPIGAVLWDYDPRYFARVVDDADPVDGRDLVDLSAPALRDGLPERLDVLPWALTVLGWGWPRIDFRDCVVYVHNRPRNVRGWPNLDNLHPDEHERAVVAAALRSRDVR